MSRKSVLLIVTVATFLIAAVGEFVWPTTGTAERAARRGEPSSGARATIHPFMTRRHSLASMPEPTVQHGGRDTARPVAVQRQTNVPSESRAASPASGFSTAPDRSSASGTGMANRVSVARAGRRTVADIVSADGELPALRPMPPAFRMPLVFQGKADAETTLPPAQQLAVAKIQNDFAAATSAGSDQPDSLDYLRRWISAQQEADAKLKLQLGWQGYLQYSLDLARQEYVDSGGHRINPLPGIPQ